MKHFLIGWLVFAECTRALAATTVSPSEMPRRLGIVRVEGFTDSHTRVFPILERRLQNWIENTQGVRAEVDVTHLQMQNSELSLAGFESQLNQRLFQFRSWVGNRKTEKTPLISDLPQLRSQLESRPRFHPAVQESLVWEALVNWESKQEKAAKTLIEKAARFHPQGQLPQLVGWDSAAEIPVGFEVAMDQVVAKQVRNCRLDIKVLPEKAGIKINGFALSGNSPFSVLGGKLYRVSAQVDGKTGGEVVAHCKQNNSFSLTVDASTLSEKSDSTAALEGEIKKKGLGSLLIVKGDKERFRLFLYSPSRGLDEMPLTYPLTVSNVAVSSPDAPLPIISDAAQGILERHRIASVSFSDGGNDNARSAVGSQAMAMRNSPEVPWYNSWTFWTIAGGLIAGGAVAYLATRKDTPVATQSRLTVQIQ